MANVGTLTKGQVVGILGTIRLELVHRASSLCNPQHPGAVYFVLSTGVLQLQESYTVEQVGSPVLF